jgi:hypothetical protein
LEAAVRLEIEPARQGFEGGGGVPATGVQEGEGELVRELQHGDVVLMMLLAREKKGWNFGSTRDKTAAGSKIAGAVFWAARAKRGRRAGQEGAVRCGGAGGAEIREEERQRRMTAVHREAPAK